MTDREAIVTICEYQPNFGWKRYCEALSVAKSALQEREKRSNGCEVCDPNPKAVWYRFKDKNVLCSFCPVCGRPLKGNADG